MVASVRSVEPSTQSSLLGCSSAERFAAEQWRGFKTCLKTVFSRDNRARITNALPAKGAENNPWAVPDCFFPFCWRFTTEKSIAGGAAGVGRSWRRALRVRPFSSAIATQVLVLLAITFPIILHAQPAYPVIFVHGLNSSGATWEKMIGALDRTGATTGGRLMVSTPGALGMNACSWYASFSDSPKSAGDRIPFTSAGLPNPSARRYFAIDFTDPNDLTFSEQGKELKAVIDCVVAFTGLSKVNLVAHSMGGLASRSYLESLIGGPSYQSDVFQLITIGTPHAGAVSPVKWCDGSSAFFEIANVIADWKADLKCHYTGVQILAPNSAELGVLNSSISLNRLPAIPYTSITGKYGEGWSASEALSYLGTDGIVPIVSQSLNLTTNAAGVSLTNQSDFEFAITNCGEGIPHNCETKDAWVILQVRKNLRSLGNQAQATALTGSYSNLKTDGVRVFGDVYNQGYVSYTPKFVWGYSLATLTNDVSLAPVTIQGNKRLEATLTGLLPGQTVYYQFSLTTSTGDVVDGLAVAITVPATLATFLTAPSGLLPVANSTGQSVRPFLSWNSVPSATSYRLLIARDAESLPTDPNTSSCAGCIANLTMSTNGAQLSGNILASGQNYYWTVKARNPDRYGEWSLPQRFDTAIATVLSAPTIAVPANGAVGMGVIPMLTWSNVSGATSYRIMIAQSQSQLPSDPTEGLCNSCSLNVTVTSNSYLIPTGVLTSPGVYYMQVKGRNAQQYGYWSSAVSFSTHNPSVTTVPTPYSIVVTSNGNGSVTGGGSFLPGNIVSVSATPSTGYAFSAWEENSVVVTNSPTYSFTSDRNRNLAATFVSSAQYSLLSLSASPANCGTVTGGGWKTYPPSGGINYYPSNFSTTVNSGCVFLGWFENGALLTLNQSDQLYATSQNRQLTAVFGVALANQTRPPPKLSVGITGGTVVLKQDGTLWNWGSNVMNAGAIARPTRITLTDSISSKAGVQSNGGGIHFWLGNGDLYGLGPNNNGVLSGTTNGLPVPVKVLSNVSEVATGDASALVTRTDGTVWMWGNNINQLNTTLDPGPYPLPPQQIPGLTNVVGVGYGLYCNAALKVDGSVWTWGGGGSGVNGCLGDGSTDVRRFPNGSEDFSPKQIPTLSQVIQISCGFDFCLALRNDGLVFAWGNNTYGQVGDGTTTIRYIPVQLSLTNVVSVHARYANGAAIKGDGTLYTWGRYENSRLGYPASAIVKSPTQVPGLSDIVEVSHTGSPMLAMQRNGDLWTWGYNLNGGLGVGTTTDVVSPMRVLCPAGMQGYFNRLSDTCSYSVTPSAGNNGTITPSTSQVAGQDGIITFTVVPNGGYATSIGGTCAGTLVGNTFTTNPVGANCTVNATFSAALPPTAILSVRSRKTHGTTGAYDLPIDTSQSIQGLLTIEPRIAGSGHSIVFKFNQTVTSIGSVTAVDGAGVALVNSPSFLNDEVIVNLSNVTNGNRVSVSVTGVNGTASASAALGFLVGDVNNSRSVNSSDISAVKARSGQPTTALNFQYDLNASGSINSSDISTVKARSGMTVP